VSVYVGSDGDGIEPEGLGDEICPATPPRPPDKELGIAYTPGSATAEQISDFRKKIEAAQKSYEAVVRQRLDELHIYEGAHGGLATVYANVRKWQDGLEPLLAEQEGRESFDIHQYGSFILDKIRENSEDKLEFNRIVNGLPTWQVYRYFLAALVLTNNGNLDVFSQEEKFLLSLLDANKAYALEDQEDLLKDKEGATPSTASTVAPAICSPEDGEPAVKRSRKGSKKEPQDEDAVEAKVRAHKKGRKKEFAAGGEEEADALAEVDPAAAKRRRKGE
jgi:hypothetical protein